MLDGLFDGLFDDGFVKDSNTDLKVAEAERHLANDAATFGPRKARILRKVLDRVAVTPEGCWEWQGPLSGDGRGGGYARMSLDGATMAVHRVMYALFYGPIAHKKQIDHDCENRKCVNPLHLVQMTHKQNQAKRKKYKKCRR